MLVWTACSVRTANDPERRADHHLSRCTTGLFSAFGFLGEINTRLFSGREKSRFFRCWYGSCLTSYLHSTAGRWLEDSPQVCGVLGGVLSCPGGGLPEAIATGVRGALLLLGYMEWRRLIASASATRFLAKSSPAPAHVFPPRFAVHVTCM